MRAASTPLSIGLMPEVGEVWPARISQKIPAMPASAPERAKAPRMTRSELTPIRRAASKSAAAALIESPNMVRWRTAAVRTSVTIATMMTTVSNTSTRTGPTE